MKREEVIDEHEGFKLIKTTYSFLIFEMSSIRAVSEERNMEFWSQTYSQYEHEWLLGRIEDVVSIDFKYTDKNPEQMHVWLMYERLNHSKGKSKYSGMDLFHFDNTLHFTRQMHDNALV